LRSSVVLRAMRARRKTMRAILQVMDLFELRTWRLCHDLRLEISL
jgi:hypothetical protein